MINLRIATSFNRIHVRNPGPIRVPIIKYLGFQLDAIKAPTATLKLILQSPQTKIVANNKSVRFFYNGVDATAGIAAIVNNTELCKQLLASPESLERVGSEICTASVIDTIKTRLAPPAPVDPIKESEPVPVIVPEPEPVVEPLPLPTEAVEELGSVDLVEALVEPLAEDMSEIIFDEPVLPPISHDEFPDIPVMTSVKVEDSEAFAEHIQETLASVEDSAIVNPDGSLTETPKKSKKSAGRPKKQKK